MSRYPSLQSSCYHLIYKEKQLQLRQEALQLRQETLQLRQETLERRQKQFLPACSVTTRDFACPGGKVNESEGLRLSGVRHCVDIIRVLIHSILMRANFTNWWERQMSRVQTLNYFILKPSDVCSNLINSDEHHEWKYPFQSHLTLTAGEPGPAVASPTFCRTTAHLKVWKIWFVSTFNAGLCWK